jgi:hypothetical protein
MAKQQINFRIDPILLKQIKDRAQQEGMTYTQWIVNACVSQLAIDPMVTFDDEMDVYAPTAIHYSESNIQYSESTLQSAIQNWEQTDREQQNGAIAPLFPEKEKTIQEQIDRISNRLRWESQYHHDLETQVYYLKSTLADVLVKLEHKIGAIEEHLQTREEALSDQAPPERIKPTQTQENRSNASLS